MPVAIEHRSQTGRASSLLGFAAVVFVATFAVYRPALRAGFIWDDDAHLTPAALRSWDGLWRIWTDVGATQQYYPLLHTAFWLEHRLWGDAPLGYHATTLVLHGIAAVLLALLLRRLALRGALLAAFVFALHPVHVESVAWISEQKNTLSTVFYLGAALMYLRFTADRRWGAYVLALLLFLLGLLAKTVTATLPAALLVVVWWQRGHLAWRRDIVPLVPWLAIGAAAGLFTAWVERNVIGAEGVAYDLSPAQRCLLAARVVWFYLGKLLWPADLAFVYPRWTIDAAAWVQWFPPAAIVAVLALLWRFRRRSRAPLAAALLFGGALLPVLGFFDVYPFRYSFVADHFQYLASIPAIAFFAGTLSVICSSVSAFWAHIWRPAICLLLTAHGILTWRQTQAYRDNRTLFRATIAANPGCWMAHNNLGKELMTSPRDLPAAISHLERAIALRPKYPEAHNNLGLALTQAGRSREAIPHLETSLRLNPKSFQAHNNLGIALASSGRAADALRAFEQAAALNPGLPNIHENWAKALLLLGRTSEADARFGIAAQLRQKAGP